MRVHLPADIVLVLDDTASMQEPTGDGTGNSKIESLRNSVRMFTTILGQLRQNLDDKIGAIAFKVPPCGDWTLPCQTTWSQELVPFGALDSTLGTIDNAVENEMPADGWATPIHAGIEAGSTLLDTQPAWRRLMVLLSDGMENTHSCMIGTDIPDFKQNQITVPEISLLAVGFGAASQIDAGLLGQLALSTGGFYDTALTTIALNKWFAEALSVILEQSNNLRRTPAKFTTPDFDGYGLCCLWPTRPAGTASYPVSVRQVTALPHASLEPCLTAALLRFANTSPPSGCVEDFHLQVGVPCRAHHQSSRRGLHSPSLSHHRASLLSTTAVSFGL